jgi:predicted transcriptional regulator of viral defense system
MNSSRNLIEQLNALPFFTKMVIQQLGNQLELKNASIDTYISRFLKYKKIIRLKNGFYVASDFFNKNKADISYTFYLANVVRTPSYVSSWTALQYYNLATESIYTITSISPKVTRLYKTRAGTFSFQSINEELFSGFSLIKGASASSTSRFDFFMASPPKALFDLLYFKTHQFRSVQFEDVRALVEEIRVDINEMTKKDRGVFFELVRKQIRHE